MHSPALRHEVHYGDRLFRCFRDRPADIDAMFREVAARCPDRMALVLESQQITYRELDDIVDRVAANLTAKGLKGGDRVALLLGNCLEFVYAVLAAARTGIVVVPLNTRQRRPEIEYVLNHCGAAALIYQAEHAPNLPEPASIASVEALFVVGEGPGTPFETLLEPGRPAAAAIGEEDAFCLLYTSGTTGRPKGAILTHLGTVHSVLHYEQGFRLGEDEVSLLAVPASHVTGLVAIILLMLRVGGCTVLMPVFKAKLFLELAARERMTYTLIVPAMYNLCLLDPDFCGYDLSRWRIAGFGGAPMPLATIEKLTQTLPDLTLVNCYGSTETTSPTTLLPFGDIAKHRTSVGKVLPCADVVVVDDEGREVPPGQSGELLIGGAMVVPGYWGDAEATRKGFVGGFWVSGDIGSIDADGYVSVFDRKKDMINRAGFKVYCIEVESVLSQHPSVVESAVLGRPDPVLGERVHAFIHTGGRPADEAEVKAFCAERLSDYKVPDSITFLSEPLPRNANGKILKTALRDLQRA